MAERITYCRICEANCGMVATVEGDRVVQLRPDKDHPLSSGYACPKGIAFPEVQHDADRVTHPLRRTPSGDFERVSWDEALADIAERLGALPRESIGWYLGNPAAWSFGHAVWAKGFIDALGSPHFYSSGSQDVNNRFAASALMYGSPLRVPIPDVERTDFLLVVGANPFVSNGSVFSVPRVRDRMHDVVKRGGRVVVVDPRRTETARHFEHVPILPDGDAWLLLSLLHVIAGRRDPDLGRRSSSRSLPRTTVARTGIAGGGRARAGARPRRRAQRGDLRADRVVPRLARDARRVPARRARRGHRQPRPRGRARVRRARGRPRRDDVAVRACVVRARRSRIGGFPDVLGQLPATLMAPEITTPGRGQMRALIVSAGNPVLERARRRRPGAARSPSSTCSSRSTST